ncbi:MAG: M48 family metalloprotease, partial [Deltaproteobacteria bacterium]|nr:M48 family metalloprotease [Deltaproteobacteria bacterium]
MILPFLPIFIGVAVLFGLVRTVPSGEVLPGAWLMAEFALLACLGLAARAWPVKDPRRASPFRLAAPRLIQLVLWLGVASAMDLPASLAHGCTQWLASLGGSAGPGGPGLAGGLTEAGANAAWGVLVLNLWISDSLSVLPRQPQGSPRSGWQAGPAALWSVMRISLPMLVVVFTGMGVSMVSEGLWAPGGLEEPGISWGPKLVDLAFTLGVFTLLIPPLVRVSWGLKPLENQAAGRVIQEELAANGLHRLAVYDWPERLLVNSTAGVIGFFPRFRFMLFGGRLADSLTPEEIKAVTAHEAAHILHHHLWYTLGGLMAFVLLLEVGLEGVYSGSLFFGFGFPLWLLGVTQVAGVLLFLRFGLGVLSRGFER